MTDKAKFYNETLKKYLDIDEVVDEIIKYVNAGGSKASYKITVGTDSEGMNNAQFVTAIAVLKIGNGGRYFWTKSEKIYSPNLHERIYKETMRSIAFVQELKSRLKDKLGEEFFWNHKITVHLDVGKNGPTKDLVETVIGMVKGFGFEAVIKPESFTAFVLADRHT